MTRHGLYEIDRLFYRTLVYGALTVALAATYGAVALLGGVLSAARPRCRRHDDERRGDERLDVVLRYRVR